MITCLDESRQIAGDMSIVSERFVGLKGNIKKNELAVKARLAKEDSPPRSGGLLS
jgi:hypothetical protein